MIAGGVAAVVLLGGGAYWAFGTGGGTKPTQIAGDCTPIETFEVTDADYTLGKADAPITFIEYGLLDQ